MLLTEEEAREKFCHFAKDGQTVRKFISDKVSIRHSGEQCIASDCMAWRWVRSHKDAEILEVDAAGCCGLAGKAET